MALANLFLAGCCFSRSAGPNSPYPGGAPNASARHINPPPLTLPEGVQAGSRAAAQASPRRRRRDPGPLDQHINKPLRRHQWTSKDRRWTRRELDTERADFFDTRVTGRSEIWQTIHAALQVLWDPAADDSNDDGLNGLGTSQSILSAAEISLPTGDLSNGVYDALGNYYQLPQWVVADPTNLAEDGEVDTKVDLSTAGEDTVGEDDELAASDAERRREEKGKAVVDLREQITLRARLSETGRDIDVTVGKSDTVRSVVRSIASGSALPPTKKIRLAYMGKMLKENSSLEAQGWQTGHVVNALIFNR
ncbi:Ubiquitin domain-containing protein 2 [Tolypocladium paradoxum]|uniref:Ubiquitin domain-containing protein 2 n=1 Tax=Tolypocladium paradoxum TaxID=94208 RepID=A0A2S4L9B7_9HYPO|nr:Ubiquitin domain-containing protein 2 [Tolypocladium paradoxum]